MTDPREKKNSPPGPPSQGTHYPFSPEKGPGSSGSLTPIKLDKPSTAKKEAAPSPGVNATPPPAPPKHIGQGEAPQPTPQPVSHAAAKPPAATPPPPARPVISAATGAPATTPSRGYRGIETSAISQPSTATRFPQPTSGSDQTKLRSLNPPTTAVPAHAPPDPAMAGEAPSREERVTCSFPGLMKVLIPERSFVPFPIAVRIANLSSGGALVEIHDSVKLDKELTLTNRFFELKVAHPDIPELRGSIAWSDYASKNPRLGLSCFERNPALSQVLLTNESAITWEGPPPLPPPEMDPFPPVSSQLTMIISGTAPEAMEVIVKRDDFKYSAQVIKGRFQVSIELDANGENHFTLRTLAGTRKSRAIPIRIAYMKESRRRHFFFDTELNTEPSGEQRITLEFNGSVRQAERVLYRFSQIMAMSERVTINAELSSQSTFDRRLFEALRAEGAVLAADTTRNHMAAKLLDELL